MVVVALVAGACAWRPDGGGSRSADRPGEPWYRVTLCSSIGPASIDMPGPVRVDGPRPLAHLSAPAEGTFAVSYGSTDDRRYDAFVIDEAAHVGSTGVTLARGVLLPLDGDRRSVALEDPVTVDDHVEVPYVETFDDRKMYSHALAGRGVVCAFSVGLRDGTAPTEVDLGHADLDRMRRSVSFPALDAAEPETDCTPSRHELPS